MDATVRMTVRRRADDQCEYCHIRPTGRCQQNVAGTLQGPAAGLAICRYSGESGYYLFGCNLTWESVTDTWHQTLDEAKAQAEFEYDGVSATWHDTI